MSEESKLSDAEIAQAIELLRRLRATPNELLDRRSPQNGSYKLLRAELSRCMHTIQEIAVADRKSFVRNSKPRKNSKPTIFSSTLSDPICYMCGQALLPCWPSNPSICQKCGELNNHFRKMKIELTGYHAVVTGGRMGVGFAVARRLLECGATVHLTTRFPYDAGRRFAAATGRQIPSDRLRIHGLDFRDLGAVHRFIATIRSQCEPDILINNTAQTVRLPTGFYLPLLKNEQRTSSINNDALAYVPNLDLHRAGPTSASVLDAKLKGPIAALARDSKRPFGMLARIARVLSQTTQTGLDASAFPASALLSQVQVLPGDVDDQQWITLDENGRSIDLRKSNTWTQKIDDVDPVEMVEVQCINSIAPFMLTQGLFTGLAGTTERPKFIVNLAAAEGAFAASHHRGTHPHTNMAKAALNMLTRTIANDFASRSIYVNSVDPGWVSDQRPRSAIAAAKLFPPLSYEDGAARVMHPILVGFANSTQRFKGRLLRHYRPASW